MFSGISVDFQIVADPLTSSVVEFLTNKETPDNQISKKVLQEKIGHPNREHFSSIANLLMLSSITSVMH